MITNMPEYQKQYYVENKERISKYNSVRNRTSEVKTKRNEAVKVRARTTPRGRFSVIKGNARSRGRSFDLTFEQFMTFWQKPCIVGCKIETIGLDRIDSSKGYTIDNVRPMCWKHNNMKNKFSDQELIEFGKALDRPCT